MNRQPLNARRSLARAERKAAKLLEAKAKAPHGYKLNAAKRLQDAVTKALMAAVRVGAA